jgi:hypothetical protein
VYGVPALLALLVTAGAIRWVASGRLSRAERFVSYLAALVAACCILSLSAAFVVSLLTGHGSADNGPSGAIEWFTFAFPWLGLVAGIYLLRRNARTGVPDAVNAIAAMQVVYVIAAIFCFAVWGTFGWQVGAYFVAVTTVAYLVQIVGFSVAAKGHAALAQK